MELNRRMAMMGSLKPQKEIYDFDFIWNRVKELNSQEGYNSYATENSFGKFIAIYGDDAPKPILKLEPAKTYSFVVEHETTTVNLSFLLNDGSTLRLGKGVLNSETGRYEWERTITNVTLLKVQWETGAYKTYKIDIREI